VSSAAYFRLQIPLACVVGTPKATDGIPGTTWKEFQIKCLTEVGDAVSSWMGQKTEQEWYS